MRPGTTHIVGEPKNTALTSSNFRLNIMNIKLIFIIVNLKTRPKIVLWSMKFRSKIKNKFIDELFKNVVLKHFILIYLILSSSD